MNVPGGRAKIQGDITRSICLCINLRKRIAPRCHHRLMDLFCALCMFAASNDDLSRKIRRETRQACIFLYVNTLHACNGSKDLRSCRRAHMIEKRIYRLTSVGKDVCACCACGVVSSLPYYCVVFSVTVLDGRSCVCVDAREFR